MMDFKHKGEKVLLAEGKNDCHVILSLCKQHAVPQVFGFYDCGSDKKVLKKMSALIAGAEPIDTIGIVLDADNPNLSAKWDAVNQRLTKEGYVLPTQPTSNGTIIEQQGKPTIGIWFMPDNNVDGMLEDFCHRLIDEESLAVASECVGKAQAQKVTSFIDNHHAKAVIHTFLAWQNEPGMPLGQAITARALDGNKPLAIEFSAFLKRLF
ncbi:MAG: hypothetical protein ACI8WB_000337 [Phenylobacterium sp.]|jgi:hypothetical protein